MTSNKIIRIAREWIGTPYIHQASVKHAGCDCLGLLRGVYRELHGDEPQSIPPYSEDWSEASREETLRNALAQHLTEIPRDRFAPGDIAIFRMAPHAPAKHCGIIGLKFTSPLRGGRSCEARTGGGLTLIHARQNKRVSEEPFSPFWQRKLAYAFRL